jgi:hypothetical protein
MSLPAGGGPLWEASAVLSVVLLLYLFMSADLTRRLLLPAVLNYVQVYNEAIHMH